MEHPITYIGFDSKRRYFFFYDYDEARAFAKMFDGDYVYSGKGYMVKI